MGEILEVGTEAETCLMAGRGMNGLRGTVVCFNASNQRYTLELDSGEMMSLRARNVQAVTEGEEESVITFEEVKEEPSVESVPKKGAPRKEMTPRAVPSEVKKEPAVTKKPKAPSSLPNFTGESAEDYPTKESPDTNKYNGNIVDRFLYAVFGAFLEVSPSVILLVALVAYWANKMLNGGSSERTYQAQTNQEESEDDTTTNDANDPNYYHCDEDGCYYPHGYRHHSRPWYWRRWWYHSYDWHWYGPHWYYWGWYGLSGMFSVGVVSFFIWQFGTKHGQTNFSWNNVKARVARFDFWEVMRYGTLLQGAVMFVMNMANAGGTRGVGRGRRGR